MQGLHDAAGEKVRAEVRGLGGQSVAETWVAVWCSSIQAAMEGQATMCECLQGVWAGMAAVGCGNKHLSPTITYRGGAWRMGTVGCTKNKAGRKDGVPLIASSSGCWCAGTPPTVHRPSISRQMGLSEKRPQETGPAAATAGSLLSACLPATMLQANAVFNRRFRCNWHCYIRS